MSDGVEKITLGGLVRRFWKKTALTWMLVFTDGLLYLLFPLLIGRAVDFLLKDSFRGLWELAVLCGMVLLTGAGRRFYDTRAYAGIYETVSNELVARETARESNVSVIAARTNLFTEFVEFLENSLPDIITQLIGFVGTLVIIAFISLPVFGICLGGAVLTLVIYSLSEKKITSLNKGQNDEMERRVDVLTTGEPTRIAGHFKSLMRWNIRLSDLETVNFSLVWIAQASVLLGSIAVTVSSSTEGYGRIIALVMYVFGFIESVMTFPLYYQQLIRLREIGNRLSGD